jgi:hypothetical protein
MEGITGLLSNGDSGQPVTTLDSTAPGTPSRGEAMQTEPPLDESLLDSPTTPQENAHKIKTSRSQSTGITSLVVNMNLTKETDGSGAGKSPTSQTESDDDCAFQKSCSGDPTQPQKQRARIHAGTNTGEPASAEKGADQITGTGTGTGTPSGTGTSEVTGTGTGTASAKNAKTFEFPPAYYNVRKQRANALSYVELPTVEGNRRKSATCVKIQHCTWHSVTRRGHADGAAA